MTFEMFSKVCDYFVALGYNEAKAVQIASDLMEIIGAPQNAEEELANVMSKLSSIELLSLIQEM